MTSVFVAILWVRDKQMCCFEVKVVSSSGQLQFQDCFKQLEFSGWAVFYTIKCHSESLSVNFLFNFRSDIFSHKHENLRPLGKFKISPFKKTLFSKHSIPTTRKPTSRQGTKVVDARTMTNKAKNLVTIISSQASKVLTHKNLGQHLEKNAEGAVKIMALSAQNDSGQSGAEEQTMVKKNALTAEVKSKVSQVSVCLSVSKYSIVFQGLLDRPPEIQGFAACIVW